MRGIARLVVFLIAVLLAAEGGAIVVLPNRLPNPDFDFGIAGWGQISAAQGTWDPDVDADGDPTSGSLRVAVNGEAGTELDAKACVPIVGGEPHGFAVRYFIPPGQIPSGEARLLVQWWDDPDCVGTYMGAGVPTEPDPDVVDAWTYLVGNDTPPVNADSAFFGIGAHKLVGQENQPDYVVYFDDAILSPEPGGVLATSAALATLLVRRARWRA